MEQLMTTGRVPAAWLQPSDNEADCGVVNVPLAYNLLHRKVRYAPIYDI